MKQKILKHVRRLRWSLPSSDFVGFRWHVGRPNFGDDLNPFLWQAILAKPIRLVRRNEPHVLGMGSILELATESSLVAGAGFLRQPHSGTRVNASVLSVRGSLSADFLEAPALLGDPAVLTSLLFPRSSKPSPKVGLVPHVTEINKYLAKPIPGVEIIDVRLHPLEVVARIANCSRILSRSLHGLIVADSFQVPNLWLAPNSDMLGGEFKFLDYYSTTNSRPVPQSIEPEEWASLPCSRFSVACYNFDRLSFLEGLRDGINSWIYKK